MSASRRWTASLLPIAVLAGLSAPAVPAQASSDEQAIRQQRESSNAAIARHDIAGFAAILAPDVIVVTSNSLRRIGRDANVEGFAEQFRTRPDVVYRRTPEDVRVFAPWVMASESGRWTGSWTDQDGRVQLTGRYFAKWRKRGDTWLVESETYVPETCTGGAYCTRIPD
jgi:uncharacterized protein (TIGR02246 family)